MTTTSANIAGVIKPLGGLLRRPASGWVYDIDEIQPTGGKKRKCHNGMFEFRVVGSGVILERVRGSLDREGARNV